VLKFKKKLFLRQKINDRQIEIKTRSNLEIQAIYTAFHGNPSVRSDAVSLLGSMPTILRLDNPLCNRTIAM
jgi:hypothetical protein